MDQTDIVDFGVEAVDIWKGCGYMPPNLKLHCYNFCLHSLTSSDHPAELSIYSPIAGNVVNKYPVIRLSLYPNVELLTCPITSVCSSVSHCSDLIVYSSSQDLKLQNRQC